MLTYQRAGVKQEKRSERERRDALMPEIIPAVANVSRQLRNSQGDGKVGIIVLNWNRPKETIECLESLLPFVKQGLASIVVCDNASGDGSEAQIRTWAVQHFSIPSVKVEYKDYLKPIVQAWDLVLIQTGGNRGYAGGNNVGVRYILSQGSFEFVWILNNDTVVDKQALDALCQCARRHPQTMVFGSTLLEYTDRQRVQSAGGYRYFPVLTIIKAIHRGKSLSYAMKQTERISLDCVNGAALFARISLFKKIGLLNESYFLYYEELDLAERMKQRGYKARWCKNSLVYHKGAASTGGGSAMNPKGSWLANYHENLSTLKYTAAHHPWMLPFVIIFRFFAKCTVYLLRRQFYLFSALTRAYIAFFIGNQEDSRLLLSKIRPRILFYGRIKL